MRFAFIIPAALGLLLLAVDSFLLEVDGPLSLLIAVGTPISLVGGLVLAGFELFCLGRVYTKISADRLLWWTALLNLFGSLSCFCMSVLLFVPVALYLDVYLPGGGRDLGVVNELAFILAFVASYLLTVQIEYSLLRRLQRGHQEIEPARIKRLCWIMNGCTHGVVFAAFLSISVPLWLQ